MINFKDIHAQAIPFVEELLNELKVKSRLVGKQLQYINPLRDDIEYGSASINIENGIFKDFAGDEKGGDLVAFTAGILKTNQTSAAEYLQKFLVKQKGIKPVSTVDAEVTTSFSHTLVCPIPVDAPPVNYNFNYLGIPTRKHVYYDKDGQVVCYIYGFDKADGKKTFSPLTLHKDCDGRLKWKPVNIPAPRPLYNLHLLTQKPAATVLIVEGEKTADAAAQLFPDFIVVTTMNGSQSPEKSDLKPLIGRKVLIWPDHDEPGQKYADKLTELLYSNDAKADVNIMLPITYTAAYDLNRKSIIEPGFTPEKGWDAADALTLGWTNDHIRLLPETIYVKAELDKLDYMVANFKVSDDGVYQLKKKDGETYEIWLCSKLEVMSLSRDITSNSWGLVLEFHDKDKQPHSWCIPKSMLVDSRTYRSELLRMGLDVASNDGSQLSTYLQACNPSQRTLAVTQPGWYNNVYILPNRVFGKTTESVRIQTNDPRGTNIYQQQGTLNNWQENVGKFCVGNSRIVLSVCAGLSGPFLNIFAEESGGVHFVGQSSTGKTSAVQVAASLWGSPEYVVSWRTTDNALEAIAARHNDNLLILDEMSQVGPEKAGEIAYMLGNGQGKSRATRTAEIQKGRSWRIVYLSTGEVSLADHMSTANKRTMAGQEVRLVNLQSDAGQNMGLFENIHSVDNPQAFSQLLKHNTASYYGSAGIALLESLVAYDSKRLRNMVKAIIQSFMTTYVPVGADGQVLRIAQRFALFAAIGEFAISEKILPWSEGEAIKGVSTCFTSWLNERGGIGAQENDVAIAQVRRFIEMNGDSRFTNWSNTSEFNSNERPTINRAGFKRQTDDGRTEYIIFPEVWKTEICSGLSHNQVSKALIEAGLLFTNNGRSTHSIRLPGLGNTRRVYIVKADIMGSSED
ncbi:MAG: DUF927 domain-containing protein [Methylotenera sp.]